VSQLAALSKISTKTKGGNWRIALQRGWHFYFGPHWRIGFVLGGSLTGGHSTKKQ
jgi:hypothetical protein